MIDKSREFWYGTEAADITEWLSDYIEDEKADVKPIVCHECGSRVFTMQYDEDEGAAEVKCAKCHTKKKLLDSEDYWEDVEPVTIGKMWNLLFINVRSAKARNMNMKSLL